MLEKKNNKMHLKGKKKKSHKIKYLVYIFIVYLSFAVVFYYSMRNSGSITNTEFINYLVNGGNVSMLEEKFKLTNVVNKTMNILLNIDFRIPTSLLNMTILSQGEVSEETSETITLEHNDDYSNLEELKDISEYIEDPNPVDVNNPVIYLYNSHQLENYNSKNLDIYGITPNVLMASYILKEKLNRIGISTIVEDTNLTDFLNINGWSHSASYKASRVFMLEKKTKYDSLEYFIDIHRDSVSASVTTTTINDKSYARILFVIGLEHDNYQANLDLANDINNLINEYYPGLSRGIYKKEGAGVDGIYNQDISPNVMLIELGGVDNTIEEVFNTIEALSVVLESYINGDSDE